MSKVAIETPNLDKVLEQISQKSVFQKKAINNLLKGADSKYLSFAEELISRFIKVIGRGDGHDRLADAYIGYTKKIRIEEMYFRQEKKYRNKEFASVYEAVYGRDDYMLDYVLGLGMTQIFWPNHYAIVRFFLDEFIPLVRDFEKGCEVGVGHGLFHSELIRNALKIRTTMFDISPVSLDTTKKMIAATGNDPERSAAVLCDIAKGVPLDDGSLDTLLMGEFIEHIEDGEGVLSEFSRKMKKSGYAFFTTAANAPAEDHILLFRTTGEIRNLLKRTGWNIHKEYTGTLNMMSIEEAERDGHNINFASILSVSR